MVYVVHKFEELVHLVAFITITQHDARYINFNKNSGTYEGNGRRYI